MILLGTTIGGIMIYNYTEKSTEKSTEESTEKLIEKSTELPIQSSYDTPIGSYEKLITDPKEVPDTPVDYIVTSKKENDLITEDLESKLFAEIVTNKIKKPVFYSQAPTNLPITEKPKMEYYGKYYV